MTVTMERSWFGPEIQTKVDRASGRAIVATALEVAVETKKLTDIISGDLRRSIHAAPYRYDGAGDELAAPTADLMMSGVVPHATKTLLGHLVEVGSWMPYACVEWVGRGHPGVTQGLESVRGIKVDMIVRKAFQEEGLI